MKAIFIILLILISASTLCAEPLSTTQQQESRRLFSALGCQACHDFEKSGSTLAPSLDRIGLKLSAEKILQRLTLPVEKLGSGETFMPSYQTTPFNQLDQLSRFLENRK